MKRIVILTLAFFAALLANAQVAVPDAPALQLPADTQTEFDGNFFIWNTVGDSPGGEPGTTSINMPIRQNSLVEDIATDDVITTNSAPTAPVILSPAIATQATMLQQTLVWKTSTDPDNDPVRYTVYVGESPTTLTPYAIEIEDNFIPFGNAGTLLNNVYYWKVMATDDKGGQTESALANFKTYINYDQSVSVTLISPDPGAKDVDVNPVLTWNAVPNRKYDVYMQQLNGMVLVAKDLTTTSYTVTGLYGETSLAPHTGYAWQIIAKSTAGSVTASGQRAFTTRSLLPSKPELTAPVDQALNQSYATTVLQWKASLDADNDKIRYDVYLGTTADALQRLTANTFETSYAIAPDVLKPATTYYWQIIAGDDQGHTNASQVWQFTTKATEQPGTYIITGRITDTNGQSVAAVKLLGFDDDVYTDIAGNYSAEVPAGWSGVVSPEAENKTFQPQTRSYTHVDKHYEQQDYVAQIINSIETPAGTTLSVYPNPTNGAVQIKLDRALTTSGKLVLTNMQGQEIVRLVLKPGQDRLTWDGADAAGNAVKPGMYYAQLYVDNRPGGVIKVMVIR